MPPVGSVGPMHNLTAASLLWNRNQKFRLGVAFDSSGGFRLPDKARRAPDAAWISNQRRDSLSKEEQKKLAPLTPDFIIEIRSESDSLKEQQEKMQEWVENGCRLAWLIDPLERKACVYTAQGLFTTVEPFKETLSGEAVLRGFELHLSLLQ